MKTVKIECFDGKEDYPLFSVCFTTIEYVDLLQFVENGMEWPYRSKWLEGIKQGIESIKSGYFDNESFTLKASVA